jgi:hypothetical protein
MRIITGRVVDGKVEVEDGDLEEGSLVTIVAPDPDASFAASAAEEQQLLDSLAQCERGETITAEQLFARLRRPV